MRIRIRLAVVAASLALGLASAEAATPAYTNLVQTINLALTATVQGQVVSNLTTTSTNIYTNINSIAIATRDFINDLARLTGTNYTSQAQLFRVVSPTNNSPRIFVVDVVNNTNVYFPVSSNNFQSGTLWKVTQSTTPSNGQTTGTIYANDYFFMASYYLGAALEGYATTTIQNQGMSASVTGSGAFTNGIAIYRGTINFSPQRTEVNLPIN